MSRISIDFTEGDLWDLQEGEEFDWTFPDENGNDVHVHLYRSDGEDEE